MSNGFDKIGCFLEQNLPMNILIHVEGRRFYKNNILNRLVEVQIKNALRFPLENDFTTLSQQTNEINSCRLREQWSAMLFP